MTRPVCYQNNSQLLTLEFFIKPSHKQQKTKAEKTLTTYKAKPKAIL